MLTNIKQFQEQLNFPNLLLPKVLTVIAVFLIGYLTSMVYYNKTCTCLHLNYRIVLGWGRISSKLITHKRSAWRQLENVSLDFLLRSS